MNSIRRNTDKEEVLLSLRFKMPLGYMIISIILIIITAFPFFVITFPIFLSIVINVRKWKCEITNKTIKGTMGILEKRHFSYRLDSINYVEVVRVFGVNSLQLFFANGSTNQTVAVRNRWNNDGQTGGQPFVIKWVVKAQEAYEKINELIGSIKNDIDLKTDIEMKKIDAEEKKAEAFVKMAEGLSGKVEAKPEATDYITQMERLFKLKEQGIITEEEFNKKKSELL